MSRFTIEGFWSRVEPEPNSGCLIWLGATGGKADYGVCYPDGKRTYAHRFAYELAKGPIPDGLMPDHLCRVHRCVNFAHMELVTNGVNILRGVSFSAVNARKEGCPHGHAYDEANTYVEPSGKRHCRACGREWWRKNNP